MTPFTSRQVKGLRPITRLRGQGQVEYILLIGLVCLFIVAALIWFRDAVADYTLRLADWIEGKPPTQVTPASLSPAKPPATPEPSPSPDEVDLAGDWCVDDVDTGIKNAHSFRFEPAGDGTYRVFYISRDNRSIEYPYSATTSGSGQFTFSNARASITYVKQPDGSYSDGGWIFRRC